MKHPNPQFSGMHQVTTSEIDTKIIGYTSDRRKLELLRTATTLSELIDLCIENYRAWADAVLMGAGAYLKIGKFPDEITKAKEYVKQEVLQYLRGNPFSTASEFDTWHKTICLNLSDSAKFFAAYSAYRKESKDKFKNRSGFTQGNAQKFLNMLMKDLYAYLHRAPGLLPDFEAYFQYCHMPLDSYILRFIDDIRYREGICKQRTYTWSGLTDYDAYMEEQNDIRHYVVKYNPEVTVLQTEFVVWELYK